MHKMEGDFQAKILCNYFLRGSNIWSCAWDTQIFGKDKFLDNQDLSVFLQWNNKLGALHVVKDAQNLPTNLEPCLTRRRLILPLLP